MPKVVLLPAFALSLLAVKKAGAARLIQVHPTRHPKPFFVAAGWNTVPSRTI
jgi:hypothetical protein